MARQEAGSAVGATGTSKENVEAGMASMSRSLSSAQDSSSTKSAIIQLMILFALECNRHHTAVPCRHNLVDYRLRFGYIERRHLYLSLTGRRILSSDNNVLRRSYPSGGYLIPDGVELRPHSIAQVIRNTGTSTLVRFVAAPAAPVLAAQEPRQLQCRDHNLDCGNKRPDTIFPVRQFQDQS